MKKVLKWLGISVLGLIVLAAIFGESEEETVETNDNIEASEQEKSEPVSTEVKEDPEKEEKKDETSETEKEEVVKEEQPKEEKKPDMTLGQQNAVGAAKNYLNFTAFSKQGLIEQLEFDQFSNADAKFAVENIEVDWSEQAVKAGETYLEFSSFSRGGLIDQLKFDGFTEVQATYAVDQIGL